jgi:hypothetical protein
VYIYEKEYHFCLILVDKHNALPLAWGINTPRTNFSVPSHLTHATHFTVTLWEVWFTEGLLVFPTLCTQASTKMLASL